jgi:hypothetical protein
MVHPVYGAKNCKVAESDEDNEITIRDRLALLDEGPLKKKSTIFAIAPFFLTNSHIYTKHKTVLNLI